MAYIIYFLSLNKVIVLYKGGDFNKGQGLLFRLNLNLIEVIALLKFIIDLNLKNEAFY